MKEKRFARERTYIKEQIKCALERPGQRAENHAGMPQRSAFMPRILAGMAEGFAQLLFPEHLYCMACNDLLGGENAWGLCTRCMNAMFSEDILRRTTIEGQGESGVSHAISCTVYGGLSKEILSKFKNKNQPWMAQDLGRLMAERYREECWADEANAAQQGNCMGAGAKKAAQLVTFVPMHESKRQKRGYDQAQLLAQQTAKALELPYCQCLQRIRATAPMKNMSQAQRLSNVNGAFAWKPLPKQQFLAGTRVLLIDDIVTTGSTAKACAEVLRRQGAADVTLLTFAAAASGMCT